MFRKLLLRRRVRYFSPASPSRGLRIADSDVDGVERGQSTVQLRTANSSMGRDVTRTKFLLGLLPQAFLGQRWEQCLMAELESMIALWLEVCAKVTKITTFHTLTRSQTLLSRSMMARIATLQIYSTSSRCTTQRQPFSSVGALHGNDDFATANGQKLETILAKVNPNHPRALVLSHVFLGPIDSTASWSSLIKVRLTQVFGERV